MNSGSIPPIIPSTEPQPLNPTEEAKSEKQSPGKKKQPKVYHSASTPLEASCSETRESETKTWGR